MATGTVSFQSRATAGTFSFYSGGSRSTRSGLSFLSTPTSRQRWTLCVFCCLAFAIITFKNALFDEVTLFVQFPLEETINTTSGCPFVYAERDWKENIDLLSNIPEFLLQPKSVAMVKSIYYAFNLLAVVPAGVISDLGYPRSVLGAGVLLTAVRHILMPKVGQFGYTGYITLLALQGIGEALIFPSVFSLISRYNPPWERNFFTALVVAGFYYGFLLGHLFFNLVFVKYKSWVFGNLAIGAVSSAWLICWVVAQTSFKRMSLHQREDRLTFINRLKRFWLRLYIRLRAIPWRQILFSRPFLSLLLVYYCLSYCFSVAYYNFYLVLILYQKHILHIPSGIAKYSNLMVTACIPSSFIGALFADWVIKKNYTSKTVIKRGFAFVSVFSSAILQVALPLVGCNLTLFWIVVTANAYLVALALPLLYSNPIDLSYRHAGLLTAFMNSFRSIAIIFDNTVIENLYPDLDFSNSYYWRNAYFVFAALAVILVIPFLFFGSGETQPWNRPMPRYVRRVDQPPIPPETSSELLPNSSSSKK